MALEVRIVDGERILFRAPIQGLQSSGGSLALELGDETVDRLVEMHALAANGRRLRMMVELLRRGEMQFTELLDIAENPKLVSACMKPMVEEGLVEHEGWGSGYRATSKGEAFAALMTAALASMMDYYEEVEDGDE